MAWTFGSDWYGVLFCTQWLWSIILDPWWCIWYLHTIPYSVFVLSRGGNSCYCMFLEGVMRFSSQSGLGIVVNSFIVAVVAAIVVFLLKGNSRILLQRRSEESIKIYFPKKVQRTYEYTTVWFSIWRSQIWRQN